MRLVTQRSQPNRGSMSIVGQGALYAVSLLKSIQVLDYLHLLKDKDLREFLAEQHKCTGL